MIAEYFYKGLLIGFLFGVPAGAIGALTIGRTLDKGFTAGFLIIGIFTGTLCWWLALCGITAHFRDKVTGKIYRWLNCILGCLMIGFGILMAVRGLRNGL